MKQQTEIRWVHWESFIHTGWWNVMLLSSLVKLNSKSLCVVLQSSVYGELWIFHVSENWVLQRDKLLMDFNRAWHLVIRASLKSSETANPNSVSSHSGLCTALYHLDLSIGSHLNHANSFCLNGTFVSLFFSLLSIFYQAASYSWSFHILLVYHTTSPTSSKSLLKKKFFSLVSHY